MDLRERAYCDRILRVDLSSGEIHSTPLPEEAMPLLLGGKESSLHGGAIVLREFGSEVGRKGDLGRNGR